jgi:hypothetical protein
MLAVQLRCTARESQKARYGKASAYGNALSRARRTMRVPFRQ